MGTVDLRNWRAARPGDHITLPDGVSGEVVVNFELGLFAAGYEPGGWADDEGGLLVGATFGSLMRYPREFLD
jgi:hypothetical protein